MNAKCVGIALAPVLFPASVLVVQGRSSSSGTGNLDRFGETLELVDVG